MNTLKLQNQIVKFFLELFVFNRTRRAVLKSRWAKLKIKKYVGFALKNLDTHQKDKNTDSKIIWQYWHQGKEKAPVLIQKCFESIEKYHPDYEIKVLDFASINQYVELPQKMYDLLKENKIPIAIFSDILRLNLLKKYGGVWIDSTIYLTDRLPDTILNSDFTTIKKDEKTDNQENKMSCYFIRSTSNNKWLNMIKDSLENYWSEQDYLVNYFIFEHLTTMLSNSSDQLKQEWENLPDIWADDCGLLQKILFENFDEQKFAEIKQKTCIHKLSYKIIKDKTSGNSYYDWIINQK